MFDITKEISNIIQYQFPSFYNREGREFINFVQTYFEFLEQKGNVLELSKDLPRLRDIDSTKEELLQYFVSKYMPSIPNNLLVDKRFLQKHILDVYRSKGSIEGLKLLFRLLFDEDIFVYIPSVDILKADDGKWIERKYFEVTRSPMNFEMTNNMVYGSTSGAKCIIEHFEKRKILGKEINLLYVSEVFGNFLVGETLLYEGYEEQYDFFQAPRILGSPNSVSLTNYGKGFNRGDRLKQNSSIKIGKNLELRVQDTFEGSGFIKFDLIDGGSGYSKNAAIQILSEPDEIGFGAAFEIYQLKDKEIFLYNDKPIQPYLNVPLNASNYSANTNDTSEMSGANIDTIIQVGLNIFEVEVGTIESIITTNPGTNYKNPVTINVIDPYTSTANIPDGKGGFKGKNAVVESELLSGNNLVSSDKIKVINSGFGFNNEEEIIEFYNQSNDNSSDLKLKVNLGPIGKSPGFWKNQDGFIDDGKYLQDDFFYQEYSYEIQSTKTLGFYISILESIFHPAGNEVFGKINLYNVDDVPSIHSGYGINTSDLYVFDCFDESNNQIECAVVGNIISTNSKQVKTIYPSTWDSTFVTFDNNILKINT